MEALDNTVVEDEKSRREEEEEEEDKTKDKKTKENSIPFENRKQPTVKIKVVEHLTTEIEIYHDVYSVSCVVVNKSKDTITTTAITDGRKIGSKDSGGNSSGNSNSSPALLADTSTVEEAVGIRPAPSPIPSLLIQRPLQKLGFVSSTEPRVLLPLSPTMVPAFVPRIVWPALAAWSMLCSFVASHPPRLL